VFEQLLAKCQMLVASQPETRKKRKFRFKNPLLSLDATVIDLCATMFDWAKFRLTKGAVKLHLLLDHDGYLPSFAVITEGKKHEIRVARQMQFARGTILAFDRGYTDYQWFMSPASFIEYLCNSWTRVSADLGKLLHSSCFPLSFHGPVRRPVPRLLPACPDSLPIVATGVRVWIRVAWRNRQYFDFRYAGLRSLQDSIDEIGVKFSDFAAVGAFHFYFAARVGVIW